MTDYTITGIKQKNEPLKNKAIMLKRHQSFSKNIDNIIYEGNDVKSAVEGFVNDLTDLPSIEPADIVQFEKKWFPDLCPSGDLIADKQNPQDNDKRELKKLIHEFALRA